MLLASRARATPAPDLDPAPNLMKGIGFVNVREYVGNVHGRRAWTLVLDALERADRLELDGLVAVGWYDTYLFSRLLRQVDALLGKGDLKLLAAVGRYEAECDFNRVLRVLMRVVSPHHLFKAQSRLWSHFMQSGQWEISHMPGGTRGVLSDWAVDEALCVELTGYLGRLMEFAGGKQVSVEHVACRARQGAQCVFEFRHG